MLLLPAQPPSLLEVGADAASCIVVRPSLLLTVPLIGQLIAGVRLLQAVAARGFLPPGANVCVAAP